MQPWVRPVAFLWDPRWGQSGFLVRLASAERDADACTNWPNCRGCPGFGGAAPLQTYPSTVRNVIGILRSTESRMIKAQICSVANCWADCSYLLWFVDSCCKLCNFHSFSKVLGGHPKQTSKVHLITYVDRIWMHAIWLSNCVFLLWIGPTTSAKTLLYICSVWSCFVLRGQHICSWLATYFRAASSHFSRSCPFHIRKTLAIWIHLSLPCLHRKPL